MFGLMNKVSIPTALTTSKASSGDDISEIKRTEKGFIVIHKGGTNYLSRNGLDEDFLALLNEKSSAIT